jgi:hypothetical protein
LKYRPDLRDCELEDHLLPVTPNLGATVVTNVGYVLVMSPFPVIAADPFGVSGGPGLLTPSAVAGSGGISSLLPGTSFLQQARAFYFQQTCDPGASREMAL